MEMPDKENFIEVLTALKNFCKEPKGRECEDCPLWEYPRGCWIADWPLYWDIEKIIEAIYGEEN